MGIVEDNLLKLLKSQLGTFTPQKNGENSFQCPFCNHYKKKLQVNVETYRWHCWICNSKGKAISSLLTKMKAPRDVVQKVRQLCDETPASNKPKDYEEVVMPSNYKPLYKKQNTPEYKNALHYATKQRGLTPLDILQYNIGYCDSGEYGGMLIVPSYDVDFGMNYFTGRSYYADTSRKHKNPQASKDIVGFEHLINWNNPITIVEGAYDAIAVKDNAIPLFGKILGDVLKTAIIKHKVRQVNVCLDSDALKSALPFAEYFISNGISVKFVQLKGKDPGELGYEEVWKIIDSTPVMTFSDLVLFKIKL